MFSPAIERALQASLAAHQGQLRRSSSAIPYVVHPLHVALMLARWGVEDDVIVAGLLHDVAEDSADWSIARISAEFGPHVAQIVGQLTEDKSKGWEERKRAGIAHVPHMSPQAATAKAADKLHNLSSLSAELRAADEPAAVWARFRGGRARTLELSGELVEVLCTRIEPKIARALRAALESLRQADLQSQQLAPTKAGAAH